MDGSGGRDHLQIIGFDGYLDLVTEDPSDDSFNLILQEVQYAWTH